MKISNSDSWIEKTEKSQAFFNPWLLSIYDFFVFRFISPYLWGCSKNLLVERYDKLSGFTHLEVGVGTGYLLNKYNPQNIDLNLMDLSSNCLERSEKRLSRYQPTLWRKNILLPIDGFDKTFDSISLNYVMHCVAGDFSHKGVAFEHLKKLLNQNGVLFGTTVMKTPESSVFASMFMWLLKKIGVFNNADDNITGLDKALKQNFTYVVVEKKSASAMFYATDSESQFNKLMKK